MCPKHSRVTSVPLLLVHSDMFVRGPFNEGETTVCDVEKVEKKSRSLCSTVKGLLFYSVNIYLLPAMVPETVLSAGDRAMNR